MRLSSETNVKLPNDSVSHVFIILYSNSPLHLFHVFKDFSRDSDIICTIPF